MIKDLHSKDLHAKSATTSWRLISENMHVTRQKETDVMHTFLPKPWHQGSIQQTDSLEQCVAAEVWGLAGIQGAPPVKRGKDMRIRKEQAGGEEGGRPGGKCWSAV